jgi:predicted NodU family carbamoyl transferase
MRILGVSTTMDCGATLVEDGKVVAAVNHERFTRR